MSGTEGFEFWWLIPLFMMALCFFCARGCCAGRRQRSENLPESENGTTPDSALDILSRRYARGEIDDGEYARKRKTITQAQKGEPK